MASEERPDASAEQPQPAKNGRQRSVRGGLLAVGAAVAPMLYLWGFTVDDALVAARVAANLASGSGYRFNVDGPVTDAVTPLGWVLLLVPFATAGPLGALGAARWLGAASWLAAAYWLGAKMASVGTRPLRLMPVLVLAVCAPLAAWAGAGMETAVVTALCTLALTSSVWSVVAAGVAAAWRPELIPWAVVLTAGQAAAGGASLPRAALRGALAAAPAMLVGLIRLVVFAQAAPLAVLAKPSDLEHGLFYVGWALLWTGAPVLVAAPWTLRRAARGPLPIVIAAVVHCVSLVLAGGDWMFLARLMVPVLPGLLLAGAMVAEHAPGWATVARLAIALFASVKLLIDLPSSTRDVVSNRSQLISRAGPFLPATSRVAAVDVGWVGAATQGHVVDLAGITDPAVAVLPGGHTSKRLGPDFLRRQRVDHVLLLLPPGARLLEPWHTSSFSYEVERRVVAQSRELGFEPLATLPVGETGRAYVVLRLKDDRPTVR